MKPSLVTKIACPETALLAIRYSPNGEHLVGVGGCMNEPGKVYIWNARTREELCLHDVPTSRSLAKLAISPCGRYLATAARITNSIEFWDLDTLQYSKNVKIIRPPYRKSPAGHLLTEAMIDDLLFSSDGRKLLIGAAFPMLLDIDSDSLEFLPEQEQVSQSNLTAFSADSSSVVLGTDERLTEWSLDGWQELRKIQLDRDKVWRHVWMSDSDSIFSLSKDGQIEIRSRLGDSCEIASIKVPRQRTRFELAYSPLLGIVAIGLMSGKVLLWSIAERRQIAAFKAGRDLVASLAFSPHEPKLSVLHGSLDPGISEFLLD